MGYLRTSCAHSVRVTFAVSRTSQVELPLRLWGAGEGVCWQSRDPLWSKHLQGDAVTQLLWHSAQSSTS
jgi:hypothetical protein